MTHEKTEKAQITDAEHEALRAAIRLGIGTMPGSYVGGVLETVEPVVRRLLAARLSEQRTEIERQINAVRSERWQEHLRLHPHANGQSCPRCYGVHDALYAAAAIARGVSSRPVSSTPEEGSHG